jgi:tungstate transport system ATP-binding protein
LDRPALGRENGWLSMRAAAYDFPIRFERVSVQRGDVTLLDNLTLEIGAGSPTVLIGPNGSGKTTLLRVAMGLEMPTKGRVTWAGAEKSPPVSRAFVFQQPAMLRRSVDGNLRYALRAARIPKTAHDMRVMELKTLAGIEGLGERPARRLSGGELQRLALARALALAPAILFLDEPTASLDPASTRKVEEVICAIASSGIKIVMSTHDLGQARRLAGEIMLLHLGRLAERASAAQFFDAPETPEARAFIAGDLLV